MDFEAPGSKSFRPKPQENWVDFIQGRKKGFTARGGQSSRMERSPPGGTTLRNRQKRSGEKNHSPPRPSEACLFKEEKSAEKSDAE